MIHFKKTEITPILILLVVAFLVPILIFPPTKDVVYPRVFVVENGVTIRETADKLKEEGLITSANAFIASVYLRGGKVLAGTYYFEHPMGTLFKANQIAKGKRNAKIKKIIIPEQTTIHDIADVVVESFPNIVREDFIDLAFERSGKLYPETYYFPDDTEPSVEEILNIMTETFDLKTKNIRMEYQGSVPWEDIIKIASIIELEAAKPVDRRLISGVIYNRLEEGIPLQVDVSFLFINRKDTFDLSLSDLELNNSFNSYKNVGLPPLPIANPTISSIEAAINPVEHEYFYFLADLSGTTHFSKTFEEHARKKNIYLR